MFESQRRQPYSVGEESAFSGLFLHEKYTGHDAMLTERKPEDTGARSGQSPCKYVTRLAQQATGVNDKRVDSNWIVTSASA
jgi:hypothetical protein